MTFATEYLKRKEELFPQKVTLDLFEDIGTSHKTAAKRYSYPFTHVSIENFLPEGAYQELVDAYKARLDKGLSMVHDGEKFGRFDMYDLYSFVPKPGLDVPHKFFYSESYFKALESLFNITLSRDTFVTYHHHLPSSQDNYIHTDFSSGYFMDDPLPNGVNPWYYQTPHTKPSENSRRMGRAIAVIYYLNNLDWNEKLGGETAIFETKEGGTPVRRLAPINNNLSAFEITPHSFHNFMKNSSPSRNSIAQWFFVSPEEMKKRFPNKDIGEWN